MSAAAVELLSTWVGRRADAAGRRWLEDRLNRLAGGGAAAERDLALALGLAPRRLGKADLDPDAAELAAARAARPGWDPAGWSVDQAARVALLLAAHDGDEAAFAARLLSFGRTADVGESVALHLGLPLYPGQGLLCAWAREGARSNIRPVFEAVAHRSPYPRERFDEAAWNQMVVKALFVGSALAPIQGLDARRNAELARMVADYARERRAAGRPMPPELWRCVGHLPDPGASHRTLTSSRPRPQEERAG